MVTSNSKRGALYWWETGMKRQSGKYHSYASQLLNLHGHFAEGAKAATVELQLSAEAR